MVTRSLVLFILVALFSLPVLADDQGWNAALGGAVGGGLGAYLGNELGGRNGAIVGGALGSAAGAAIAVDPQDRNWRRYDDDRDWSRHRRPPAQSGYF
jgi:outer membrane lipoprotein SlyB